MLKLLINPNQNAPAKPYALKGWPYYRKMASFMPGTQPRGGYAFDPASTSTAASIMLGEVNAEPDGEEDQLGPPVGASTSTSAAALTSAMTTLFTMPRVPGTAYSSTSTVDNSLTVVGHEDHLDAVSVVNEALPHPNPTTPADERQPSSSHVTSPASGVSGSARPGKHKHDASSTPDMRPPSSKRSSKTGASGSKQEPQLSPVVMVNALNGTLNRMVDVMQKSIDVSETLVATNPSALLSPTHLSQVQAAPPASLSTPVTDDDEAMLTEAFHIASVNKEFLNDDEMVQACCLFTEHSSGNIRIARRYLDLKHNPTLQHLYLRKILGMEKSKTMENRSN